MGAAISISVGITLLALTSAMFLLAKTNKDGLGTMFKAVAWIIIVCCFINLSFTVLHGLMKFSGKHSRHEMKMHKKMEKKHKKWLKRNGNYHAYGEYHEGSQEKCDAKNCLHSGTNDCKKHNALENCKTMCSSDKDSTSYKLRTR